MPPSKNILLLPSARLIPPELRSDFGPIPSGMIPLDSQPAIRHIIDRHSNRSARVIVGIHESGHLIRNYVSSHPELEIECVDTGETHCLGESIASALRTVTVMQSLIINFADTMIGDKIEVEDFVCYQELEHPYRWTSFEIGPDGSIRSVVDKNRRRSESGKLPVFVGMFGFSRPAHFLSLLEQCLYDPDPGLDPFYSAVIEYFNRLPASSRKLKYVRDWQDLGHLDTYFRTKQRSFINLREFNTLSVDLTRGMIRKSSRNVDKLRSEVEWYVNLPKPLQHLVPRVFDYSVEPANTFAEIEFYGYPALNEVYLYGDWDLAVWSQVLQAIGAALDQMLAHEHPGLSSGQRADAIQQMYVDKTQGRLAPLLCSSQFEIFSSDSVQINGKRCMGAWKCLEAIPALMNRLRISESRQFTIIHGDLCLSNILYDRRSGFVRLIDPRGSFGGIELYGDPRYELAKLSHSFEGDYDFLLNGLFELSVVDQEISLAPTHRRSHRRIKDLFGGWLRGRAETNYLQVKFIESLLFLSMVPLHADRPRAQFAFLARALETFQEVWEPSLQEAGSFTNTLLAAGRAQAGSFSTAEQQSVVDPFQN